MDTTNGNAAEEDEDDQDKQRLPRQDHAEDVRRRLLTTAEKNYVIEGLEGVSQELQHQNSHLQQQQQCSVNSTNRIGFGISSCCWQ
jgi:hypothetical protein